MAATTCGHQPSGLLRAVPTLLRGWDTSKGTGMPTIQSLKAGSSRGEASQEIFIAVSFVQLFEIPGISNNAVAGSISRWPR